MNPPHLVRYLVLAALATLAGCQTLEVKQPTVEQTAVIRKGPEDRPQRSITGFSQALRCMDTLMLDYGVRDMTMLTEEITDETKKLNAGTRDMLISSVSDMSRRSRAVRLVAFGKDTMNVISFLATAQSAAAYQAIPLYDIKGSVSQFDENLIKNQKDLGFGISPFINLGIARDAASSMLALDLSVLTTSDMAVLPGVTSRNSVVILKQGRGIDGDAAYHKFGINYSMNLARSEGQSQALRGLVELAVVELIGKLTKTPYWTCLGVSDPKKNDETRLEMFDWYHSMAATRVELIAYFQNQLRRRAFYDGPIDGEFNPAIDEAISNYRAELGLSRQALLNEEFFYAFLSADHSNVKRPQQPARYIAPAPVAAAPGSPPPAAPAAPAAPLKLSLTTPTKQTRFARGESISLALAPSQDAHVYCYLQDESAKVIRFFPNRFARDSRIAAARPLTLPGAMRFQLTMNPKGVTETISCFATPRDVLASLPQTLVGTDFEPLAGATLDLIRAAFDKVSGGTFAQENFRVQAK
jgi:peptidoglycan hydrolase-like protein with peptidoglycan-binding domain